MKSPQAERDILSTVYCITHCHPAATGFLSNIAPDCTNSQPVSVSSTPDAADCCIDCGSVAPSNIDFDFIVFAPARVSGTACFNVSIFNVDESVLQSAVFLFTIPDNGLTNASVILPEILPVLAVLDAALFSTASSAFAFCIISSQSSVRCLYLPNP